MNNKKIKILHLGLSYNLGGIEKLVYTWLDNKPSNFQFDFLNACEEPLADEEKLIKKGCNIYKVDRRFTHPLNRYKQLKQIISNGNYNFIHCHLMYNDDPIPVLLANKYNSKVILHCHSMYTGKRYIRQRFAEIEAKILLHNKKYYKLACSKEAGENMFNNDFTVIENGIDINSFIFSQENRDKIRKQYNITNKEKLIGHIGRDSFEKNYPFILNTFSKACISNKNIKLMLVGDILNNKEIMNQINSLGIKDKVVLTGKVKNVNEYYSAFDLFYLPSLYEGFSITTIEAQTSGLFCVLSNGVPKSASVTNNVKYIELNEEEVILELIKNINSKINRSKIAIDKRYDSKYSSKKIFKFYENLENK